MKLEAFSLKSRLLLVQNSPPHIVMRPFVIKLNKAEIRELCKCREDSHCVQLPAQPALLISCCKRKMLKIVYTLEELLLDVASRQGQAIFEGICEVDNYCSTRTPCTRSCSQPQTRYAVILRIHRQ